MTPPIVRSQLRQRLAGRQQRHPDPLRPLGWLLVGGVQEPSVGGELGCEDGVGVAG